MSQRNRRSRGIYEFSTPMALLIQSTNIRRCLSPSRRQAGHHHSPSSQNTSKHHSESAEQKCPEREKLNARRVVQNGSAKKIPKPASSTMALCALMVLSSVARLHQLEFQEVRLLQHRLLHGRLHVTKQVASARNAPPPVGVLGSASA